MGKELYCDFCRGNIPIEASLIPVLFGETKVGDACLNCSSRMEGSMKKAIADTALQHSQAKEIADVQPGTKADEQPAEPEVPEEPAEQPVAEEADKDAKS